MVFESIAYLTSEQKRCLECYNRCKNGNMDLEACGEYRRLKPFFKTGELCMYFVSLINDIVKSRAGVKLRDGITNPAMLRALAETGIESIPREAYE